MEWLPTRLNLGRRGTNIETKCPLYERELESTSHALLYCNKLWDVWWSWHTCPINILAGNKNFADVAILILNAGTPHDLETFLPQLGPYGITVIKRSMTPNISPPSQV